VDLTMNTGLNMLPRGFQRGRLVRLCLRQWLVPWAVAAGLTAALVCWLPAHHGEAEVARLDALEREHTRLGKLETRLAASRERLADLRSQEGLVLALDNQPPDLMVIGVVSRAARQSNGAVYVKSFSLQRMKGGPGSARASDGASPGCERLLTLKGTATDGLSVAGFAAVLRDAGVFAAVELKSTAVETLGAREVASYVLECAF
jgi:hypothetical protein